MTDQEILQAMQHLLAPIQEDISGIKTELSSVKTELNNRIDGLQAEVSSLKTEVTAMKADVSGIKVVLDMEIRRDIRLLAEGHEAILSHLPDPDEGESYGARLSALEAAVKMHSKDIQALKKAQ